MQLGKFNKEIQLRNIHNKKLDLKKKTIMLLVLILIVGITCFSVYKSNNDYFAVNEIPADFDPQVIAYRYDDGSGSVTSHKIPPSKDAGYKINNISCENGDGTWDNSAWTITIGNITGKVKCTLTFGKSYLDGVIASAPELYQGMVPITYNESGVPVLANPSSKWYNYADHEWANAVLVDSPSTYLNSDGSVKLNMVGQEVTGITQYYVWIPRYRYQLFSNATNVDNLINNGNTDEQMIEIEFVKTNVVNDSNKSQANGYNKGEWYVHPAFTFGSTELEGIWVGKFEPSHTTLSSSTTNNNLECGNVNCTNASGLRILPNATSLRYNSISNFFYASRSIENTATFNLNSSEIDSHIMKNMEWGAVAYLTNSKYGRYKSDGTCVDSGCEVWINNNTSYTTGCSGSSVSAAAESICNAWNTTMGMHASTTDNQYGIYDMSGESSEFVMGNMETQANSNVYTQGNSGFVSQPASKYLDLYAYGTSATDHSRGKLGDATRETLKIYGNTSGGWYSDNATFVSNPAWFRRNGALSTGINTGIFNYVRDSGASNGYTSARIVLTQEDK